MRRKKSYYKRPARKIYSPASTLPLFRRYRFYVRSAYTPTTRATGLSSLSSNANQRSTSHVVATYLVRSRARVRALRVHHFLVTRVQPRFRSARLRLRYTDSKDVQAILTPRKAVQLLVSRRLKVTLGRSRDVRVKSRLQQAAPYRLAAWARASISNNLRLPRLLSATAEKLDQVQLVTRTILRDPRTQVSIRRRWRRLNKRGVLNFYKKGCGKCRACVVKRTCLRPKYVYVRQGRRGYAGLFGKKR